MKPGSTIVSGCLVAAIAAGGAQLTLVAGHREPAQQARATPPVAERPAHTPAHGPGQSGNLTATIARTAVLVLDPQGRPVSAMTNTGAAPRGNEQIYASQQGTHVLVSKALLHQIRTHRFTGDWSTPGEWHAW